MKLSKTKSKKKKILLYGGVGVGKSALVMTLGERLQLLDLDEGVETGKKLQDEFTSERLDIDVVECYEESHAKAVAFGKAKDELISIANACAKDKKKLEAGEKQVYDYDYVGIDSYTGLADSAVRYVLSNSGLLGKAPKIQHWGLAFIELENFLTILRSLPRVVVLVCHEQKTMVDDEVRVELATPGQKLQAKIPRYFDEIWYMKVVNRAQGRKQRVLQTQPTQSILARTRSSLEDGIDTSIGMKAILEKL